MMWGEFMSRTVNVHADWIVAILLWHVGDYLPVQRLFPGPVFDDGAEI